MKKEPICTITLTGLAGGEWQGWVEFPAQGRRQQFESLPQLIRAVESAKTPPSSSWGPAPQE